MSDAYRVAFQKAEADLINAIKQRDTWNLEIARLQQLVKSLAVAAGSSVRVELLEGQLGLSDLVQSVVCNSARQMTAIEVRDAIVKSGYDLSGYANALALIHQTLKRLAAKGTIRNAGNGRYGRPIGYGFFFQKR